MKKLVSLILILALTVLCLASCGFDRRAIKLGVSVNTEDGIVICAASVITEGDGSINSVRVERAEYTADGQRVDTSVDNAQIQSALAGKSLDDLTSLSLAPEILDAVSRALNTQHIVNFRAGSELQCGVSLLGDMTVEADGSLKYSANVGGAVLEGGRVASAVIDSFEFTVKEGTLSYKGTKLEQRHSYGMVAYAGAIAEWFVQAQTYANTAIGKTVAELAELPTENVAGCTMYVGVYKPAIITAAQNADNAN